MSPSFITRKRHQTRDGSELIGATRTRSGLRVQAELDRGSYPLGVKVADRELAAVPLRRHDWHGEWNYTVLPTAA